VSKEDDRLQLRIENKLSAHGLRAPCRIKVDVHNAIVKVTGTVPYEYQKRTAMHAIRATDGVSSIIDLLKVEPAVRQWDDDAPPPPSEPIPGD
jgi:osmotically-inducible protein OsmY